MSQRNQRYSFVALTQRKALDSDSKKANAKLSSPIPLSVPNLSGSPKNTTRAQDVSQNTALDGWSTVRKSEHSFAGEKRPSLPRCAKRRGSLAFKYPRTTAQTRQETVAPGAYTLESKAAKDKWKPVRNRRVTIASDASARGRTQEKYQRRTIGIRREGLAPYAKHKARISHRDRQSTLARGDFEDGLSSWRNGQGSRESTTSRISRMSGTSGRSSGNKRRSRTISKTKRRDGSGAETLLRQFDKAKAKRSAVMEGFNKEIYDKIERLHNKHTWPKFHIIFNL